MKSFKNKAGVYQHSCKGETSTEDDVPKSTDDDVPKSTEDYVPKSTETKEKNDSDQCELPPPSKRMKISTDKPGVSTEKLAQSESENEEETPLRQKAVKDQLEDLTTGIVEEFVRRKNKAPELNDHNRLVVAPTWAKIPTFTTVPNRQSLHEGDGYVPQHQHINRHIVNRTVENRWNDFFGLGHPLRNAAMRAHQPGRMFDFK